VTQRVNDGFLRAAIVILALADGVIHLLLDFVLFRGRFFGSAFPAGPRPGAAPGRAAPPGGPRLALPLPLNELFLLNFLGAVVLVALFLYSRRWEAVKRVWVNVIMIGYAAVTFIAWWMFGRPNPMGLGYLSKGIEILLIIALAADIWSTLPSRALVSRPS
jgi:hypothetical protein